MKPGLGQGAWPGAPVGCWLSAQQGQPECPHGQLGPAHAVANFDTGSREVAIHGLH